MEGAGVVEAVGAGVTHLQAGRPRRLCRPAAGQPTAEARVMPAEARVQAARRDRLRDRRGDDAQGPDGAVPAQAHAAAGRLQPGEIVLFHAAAGGVGLIACQWAQRAGRAADRHRRLRREVRAREGARRGARHQLHAARTSSRACKEITGGKGVKVVYDSVGKDTFDKLARLPAAVRPDGQLRQRVGPGAAVRARHAGAEGLAVRDAADAVHAHRDARGDRRRWPTTCSTVVASGKVKIQIDQRYPLADAAQAHRDLEARKTTGSTILLP